MAEKQGKQTVAQLRDEAYGLGIVLDANETRADLTAKIESRLNAITAAVELVIDANEQGTLGDGGYPTVEAVAEAMGSEGDGLKQEHVDAAADAIWEAREDDEAGDDEGEGVKDGEGPMKFDAEYQEGSAPEGVILPQPRLEVVEATERIIEAGEPLERGAPALGALRRVTGFDGTGDEPAVSKAEAAAAFEAVTGNPWPWPPTAQELAAKRAATELRYPSAMYHKDKASITVSNEAEEEKARGDGFLRDHEMDAETWVDVWARETGATAEQKAQALESVRNDPKRRKSA